MTDKMTEPADPIECPWCHSKYAPRLYGWHEHTSDGRNAVARYTVRCLNCGAQGPKEEIGPLAIEAWNRRLETQAQAERWEPVTYESIFTREGEPVAPEYKNICEQWYNFNTSVDSKEEFAICRRVT